MRESEIIESISWATFFIILCVAVTLSFGKIASCAAQDSCLMKLERMTQVTRQEVTPEMISACTKND